MSLPGKLSTYDWQKIATGAGMALVGIFGGTILDQLALWNQSADVRTYAGIAVAGLTSVGANIVRKLMTQTHT